MPDPHLLAEMLSRVLGERPLDAVIVARHTPGVLPLTMTAGQAKDLVSLLHGLGVQAASVAQAELPDLADATVVHHARSEGCEIVGLDGKPVETIAWPRISVVAIGAVPGEAAHHFVEQGRPSIVSAAPMPEVGRLDAPTGTALELWLLCRDPDAAYRLEHRQFNYESLGARKTDSATANFELFAHDLVGHAGNALRTPSTHAYLTHDLRPKYEFHSSADLQQHALLHWVIAVS
jgi:hypothetical protein